MPIGKLPEILNAMESAQYAKANGIAMRPLNRDEATTTLADRSVEDGWTCMLVVRLRGG